MMWRFFFAVLQDVGKTTIRDVSTRSRTTVITKIIRVNDDGPLLHS